MVTPYVATAAVLYAVALLICLGVAAVAAIGAWETRPVRPRTVEPEPRVVDDDGRLVDPETVFYGAYWAAGIAQTAELPAVRGDYAGVHARS